MRALVIGHAYAAPDNRVKWRCLARSGEVTITLRLPHRWPSWEGTYHPTSEETPGFAVRVAPALRAGREDQYFFRPPACPELGRGDVDVLHVEQGTTAFVYTQALMERALRRSRAKSCFFTWINWEAPLRWPWRAAERFNLRRSDGAIGGNRAAVDLLRRHGFRGKTVVIPQLGVDPEFYAPGDASALRQKLGLQGVVIGFVGRLVPEKGVSQLLRAAARAAGKNGITLLILGAGPLEKEISTFRPEGGLRVVHVPVVPHDAVRDHLRAMDLLALPSRDTPRWREQFGHVLIEAMACGVPVVGSSAGAIPEVIGGAGLVFPQDSEEELARCLETLSGSSAERARLGRLGRERVLGCYTHEQVARQTLEFWRSL